MVTVLLTAVRCTSAAGHEYGGQTVALLGQLLYSGSKDCSVRCVDITVNSASVSGLIF